MFLLPGLRQYGNGTIDMWNDCGTLQPVRAGLLLLGQRRATGDVRHRLGTRWKLLSCRHDNHSGHDLPRGQLVCRRVCKRGCVRSIVVQLVAFVTFVTLLDKLCDGWSV